MRLKACLKSMRLRTLPLSLAGVYMGLCIAVGVVREACSSGPTAPGTRMLPTIVFLLLTTALLQILSNLSNELGDALHGTDSAEERQGAHYSIMDGEMTIPQMKQLIAAVAGLCCICGLLMIHASFGTLAGVEPVLFVLLGACAIAAAMKYTLGRNPYGYRAKGDYFVFIFFGLVSTLGAFYICSHNLRMAPALLPACAIGCFSVGVLNVNNIRDMKSDERTRTTVAMKLGGRNARIYHTVLICTGWVLMLAYMVTCSTEYAGQYGLLGCILKSGWPGCLTIPLYVMHLKGVWTRNGRSLDPMLPLLVMSTFALALLTGTPLLVG